MGLSVLALDPAAYVRHALHAEDRQWVEKNCYWDVWIEVVHALGCDPIAMAPVLVGMDFEGDQWTFFKPAHDELWSYYGIDVQELNCWRSLADHAREHLAGGKLISTEADAWWLPDVAGTDYRAQHTKSTIVINAFDDAAHRMGYWHNAGYFELAGEDFDRTFERPVMPLFAELVRIDRKVIRPREELVAMSRANLARHLARRPATNPVARFGERFARDLPELQAAGLANYHAWAFATVRQLGAASELMAAWVAWAGLPDAAREAYAAISTGAKAFIMKGARAVNAKKPLDASATFAEWAGAYDRAMAVLCG